MNKTTEIVRRNIVVTGVALAALLGLSAAPAHAGGAIVHIDIPEIGHSGNGPSHLFEWIQDLDLSDEFDYGQGGGGGPIMGPPGSPGGGLPGLGFDPFSFDEPLVTPTPPLDFAPGTQPIDFSQPVSPIPAPGAAVLFGLGGLAAMGRRRR